MTAPPEPTAGLALADRYVLDSRIGTGGAGVVWRAHDDVLGRWVAVKLLHPELGSDPASAARFRAEATAAARLTHPNAVVVFDIGRHGALDYLVMELVDGLDLAELLHAATLPPGAVAYLGRSVGAALGAAHAQDLVHRDVKPGNVLITDHGVAKVADFGIARAVGAAMARLTRPGSVMGTARYVAPEQLRDDAIDARSDVYALGLVLHEALTGRAPWGDGAATEVAMRRLAADLPPVSSLRDDVPPGLDAVIARATRLDPDERHTDGADLAAALAPFASNDAAATTAGLVREARLRGPQPGPVEPVVDGDRPGSTSALPGIVASPSDPARPRSAGDTAHHPVRHRHDAASSVGHDPTDAANGTTSRRDDGTRVLGRVPPTTASVPPTGAPPPTRDAVPPPGGYHGRSGPLPPPSHLPPPPAVTRHRGRWMLLALVVVAAGIVGFLGITDGAIPSLPSTLDEVAVSDVGDHDPLGDLRERPDLLGGTTDGDDDTAWQTETYERADLIPPSKDGVGIWFDLGEVRDVRRIELDLVTAGTSFEIWVGDQVPGQEVSPDDWGDRVDRVDDASSSETLRIGGAAGRVWLIWFTELAPADDGSGHRAHIADIRFHAR